MKIYRDNRWNASENAIIGYNTGEKEKKTELANTELITKMWHLKGKATFEAHLLVLPVSS